MRGPGDAFLELRAVLHAPVGIPCTTAGQQRQPEAHPLLSWLHVRHFLHCQINAQKQGWLCGGNTSGLCLFLWPYFLSHETKSCTVYF